MGPNYINNVFYSLENGQSGPAVAETNWHIAVQAISYYGAAGIWTNEARKNGPAAKLYSLDRKATTDFMNITDADTVGKVARSLALHNDTSSYSNGAFNAAKTDNPNNYGWGNYYMTGAPDGYPDHSVVGDTLFLLNLTTSNMGGPETVSKSYVIWPRLLENLNRWLLFYRELGSTEVDTIDISTANSGVLFKYFNLETGEIVDREPQRTTWDFAFMNYMDLYGAQGMQGVTGALQNYNVTIAQVDNVIPDNADYNALPQTAYSSNINTIGNDWKRLEGTSWALVADRSYFIKVANNDIWQVYFDYFATVNGDRRIGFKKRKVYAAPLSVTKVNDYVSNVVLAPNPSANGSTNILVDAKQPVRNARITVADVTGRVVLKSVVNLHAGFQQLRLDISTFKAGMYMVNLSGDGFSNTQKLMVK